MFDNLSGAALAGALAEVDPAGLDPDAALGYALAMRRIESWAMAGEAAGLSRLHATYPNPNPAGQQVVSPGVAVSYEIAAAIGCSIPSASRRLGLAGDLAGLPATMAALRAGSIDVPRALALVDRLTVIDDAAVRRAVEERVLAAHVAASSGLTMRQWHVVAARAVAELAPGQAENRQRNTKTDREVRFIPPAAAGGDAELILRGPAEQLAQCEGIVDAVARAWKREQERSGGCPHTLAQLRFDAAVFLLTHAQPGRVPAGIVSANVTLPASSLLGLDESPGEMDRVGPVPASVAREMFARAGVWRRLVTDPLDGHVVTQEVKSYTPPKAMSVFVGARAGGVCAARGCGATRGLQNDHSIPHPIGPTSADNLCPFCQTNHNLKTHGGWIHVLDPATGMLTQTSPLGRAYSTSPLPPPASVDREITVDDVSTDRPGCGSGGPHGGGGGSGGCVEGGNYAYLLGLDGDGPYLWLPLGEPPPEVGEVLPPDPEPDEDPWPLIRARLIERVKAEREETATGLAERLDLVEIVDDSLAALADQEALAALHAGLLAETDHALIARINAQDLVELNRGVS